MDIHKERLELTEEEAFALLNLAMTSGLQLDATSEKAVRKLADYCKRHQRISHHITAQIDQGLVGAG